MPNPIDLCTIEDVRGYLGKLPAGVFNASIIAPGSGYTSISIAVVSTDGNGTGATFAGVLGSGKLVGLIKTAAGSGYTAPPLLIVSGDGTGATATAYLNDDLVLSGNGNFPGLITKASAYFLSKTNRPAILPTVVTEKRSGDGSNFIVPNYYPLISIQSVTVDNLAVPLYGYPSTLQGFDFDGTAIYIRTSGGSRSNFPIGNLNVTLAYTYGWTTIPYEVIGAVVELVAQKYTRKSHIDQVSMQMGGGAAAQTITFSQLDVPKEVQSVIDQYRLRFLSA